MVSFFIALRISLRSQISIFSGELGALPSAYRSESMGLYYSSRKFPI